MAPKLDAGAAAAAEPEVSEEAEVLLVVFDETTVEVDSAGTDEAHDECVRGVRGGVFARKFGYRSSFLGRR